MIRGGTVVDATGVPRYQADVGIKNGRVARVSGRIQAGGAREIDARGCIVAPGAIGLHTHYDAQLNWDPYATLSGWFGVTSSASASAASALRRPGPRIAISTCG